MNERQNQDMHNVIEILDLILYPLHSQSFFVGHKLSIKTLVNYRIGRNQIVSDINLVFNTIFK